MDPLPQNESSFQSLLQQVTPADVSLQEDVIRRLAHVLNDMILHHFDRLVQLLYTIDVDERKLRQALQLGEEAGMVMARLIVQRQLQKLQARQCFRPPAADISEEEKW